MADRLRTRTPAVAGKNLEAVVLPGVITILYARFENASVRLAGVVVMTEAPPVCATPVILRSAPSGVAGVIPTTNTWPTLKAATCAGTEPPAVGVNVRIPPVSDDRAASESG
jgi:hypothetical protein